LKDVAITITPRFYETDALGHINNATIAAWFEVARVNFLESVGENDPDSAMGWILASLHIDFKAETFYGSDVTASITEATLGNSSLAVQCEMSQKGAVTVTGKAVLVHMDPQTRSPSRIPESIRQRVEAL
jgi:acyl-CoA thioester hydrolase